MVRRVETLVVDSSVAAKWHLIDEEYAANAGLLLSRFSGGDVALLAPAQIRYEVPSAITAATLGRNPRLTRDKGREAIEEFLSLDVEVAGGDDLMVAAYSLAHRYGCSFYDCLYLALAEQRGVSLITADHRFYSKVRRFPHVIWLGSYQ